MSMFQCSRTTESSTEHRTHTGNSLKVLSCPECSKKFRFTFDLEQHFRAKHLKSTFNIRTDHITSVYGQPSSTEKTRRPEEYGGSSSRTVPISCQFSKTFILNTRGHVDFSATHTISHLRTNAKSSPTLDIQLTVNKDRKKVAQNTMNRTKIFSCWECTKDFKFADQRLMHFINKHATWFRSEVIELSNYVAIGKASSQDQINTVKITNDNTKNLFYCWNCTKEFAFDHGLFTHFLYKHADFIISNKTNPSSLLVNQIAMAYEQIASRKN